jgi:PAS domain S-box-containing protein
VASLSFIKRYQHYLLLFLFVLLYIGIMTSLVRETTKSVNYALMWVDHSNAAISKNQEVSILIERMISGQEAYALTGDRKFNLLYESSKAAASDRLADLDMLMDSDTAQVSRLGELRHHFLALSEKLDDLSQGVFKTGIQDSAIKTPSLDTVRNDLIRVSEDILLQERGLLDQHTKDLAARRYAGQVRFFLASASFAALLFLLNAYVFFARSVKANEKRTLSEAQEIFRLASEVASDGIFEWNFERDKAFYSRQFWTILGYLPDKFPNTMQAFKDLLHPDDRDRVLAHVDKYLSGEVSQYLIIFRMRHQSGKWVWINARGRALYNDKGKPIRIVGVHTDISHVKAYEEKLQKAKERAENANRAKTDFLAHMSHEIRTPLTTISGIAEIFENAQNGLDSKQKQLVRVLSSSTSSLKDLVSDILDFSRIESGELELELDSKVFGLQDVFDQVISIVSLKAGEKGFDFSFDYSAVRKLKFMGDRARLRQILLNLIGNAIKFTDKGSVAVTATRVVQEGNLFLRIDVNDTGIGIHPQNFELIFERFKQADSSVSRKYGGSGLGLPISLRLARLMGGGITLESVPGKGSVFTLLVPMRTTQEVQGEGETDQRLSKTLSDDIRGRALLWKKILLVEDYEGNIVVLSYLLDSLECHYDVARTGLEAVNMWKENRYDLILMDVQMPEMDGFTATAQIRRIERERNLLYTPIIGMTAHALVGDKEKCIEAGMDTYLPKPIVELDLKSKIIEFLEQKKAAA